MKFKQNKNKVKMEYQTTEWHVFAIKTWLFISKKKKNLYSTNDVEKCDHMEKTKTCKQQTKNKN